MNYYAEIDGLFVEHDMEEDGIRITNVQLTHPSDPKDQSKWIDITEYMTESAEQQIIDQIDQEYVDAAGDDGYGDYLYDCAKDRKAEERG
jgi:hypothetical protein